MTGGTIRCVQTMTVTLPDGTSSEFVIDEEREDGRLVIRRATYLDQLFAEDGSQSLTGAESDQLIAPHLVGPDDEG